ncbi:MAG: alpha/beta fold hydrolase [Actinomycetota bacterium]|nr:alpha/beta fold hydrolase [Actinomycetota bacterium]
MATLVIVHGAWSGGHAWRWVRPLLRQAGHEVFTPALTGLGERAHLARPEVDLDTHIRDVVGMLEYEDLREVVLVGHSYGGVVITGAAEHLAPRLAQLVYLDAEVPEDGQSEYDLVPPDERATYEGLAAAKGEGWRIPPPVPETLPDDLDPDVRWVLSRMVPQPQRTFTQAVRLPNAAAASLPRTYIFCTEGKSGEAPPAYVQRARSEPGWRYRELAAGHAAHVTAPRELADLLLRLV